MALKRRSARAREVRACHIVHVKVAYGLLQSLLRPGPVALGRGAAKQKGQKVSQPRWQ